MQPLTVDGGDIDDLSVVLSRRRDDHRHGDVPAGPAPAPDVDAGPDHGAVDRSVRRSARSRTRGSTRTARSRSSGVPAGSHLIRPTATLRGWIAEVGHVDGRDVTDTPIELRSGQTLSNVRGVHRQDQRDQRHGHRRPGRADHRLHGARLSDRLDAWRPQARQIMTARPDQTGKFRIRGCRRRVLRRRPSIRRNRANGSSRPISTSTAPAPRASRSATAT